MAPPEQPERVEVELVESGAPLPASSAPAAVGDEPPSPRGFLVPLVVGLIALGVGWVLGRGSPESSSDAAPTSSTTAAADPVGSIAPASPATAATTAFADTTGGPSVTQAPQEDDPTVLVDSQGLVHPDLRGQPIEIVAYGNGRQVFQLDLTTARLRSQQVGAQPFGRARLLVGPTWALLPSSDADQSSTIVWDDGRTAAVEVGTADQIVGVADGRSLWWLAPPDPYLYTYLQSLSVQGEFGEVIAALPAAPARVDPAGGVLLELPDGWFRVEPQRAVTDADTGAARIADPLVEPITTGRLLAISAEFALVEECDDKLACAITVIDRESGERRVAGPDESTRPVRYELAGGSSVAPGGRLAVVEVLDPVDRASTQRSLGVVDLTTGEVDDIGPTQDVDQVVWTPDGRFVIFLAGGRVVAHDTESGLLVVVAEELAAIEAFGVRPTGE